MTWICIEALADACCISRPVLARRFPRATLLCIQLHEAISTLHGIVPATVLAAAVADHWAPISCLRAFETKWPATPWETYGARTPTDRWIYLYGRNRAPLNIAYLLVAERSDIITDNYGVCLLVRGLKEQV